MSGSHHSEYLTWQNSTFLANALQQMQSLHNYPLNIRGSDCSMLKLPSSLLNVMLCKCMLGSLSLRFGTKAPNYQLFQMCAVGHTLTRVTPSHWVACSMRCDRSRSVCTDSQIYANSYPPQFCAVVWKEKRCVERCEIS